jgi:hypothetical protein
MTNQRHDSQHDQQYGKDFQAMALPPGATNRHDAILIYQRTAMNGKARKETAIALDEESNSLAAIC